MPHSNISRLDNVRLLGVSWLLSETFHQGARSKFWVGKRLFAAHLTISPKCVRCNVLEKSIAHAFFHCPVLSLLCKLLESYPVRVRNRKFFVLETCSASSNVVLSLNGSEHSVFLCLLGIMSFTNTKSWLRFCFREKDSLLWGLAKGGWKLRVCVAWKV